MKGCGGRGYFNVRGEPNAADPCGGCEACTRPGTLEGDTCGVDGCTGTLIEPGGEDDGAELRCSTCDREA